MADYKIENGDTLLLDSDIDETIDYIKVYDGVCNIVNDTDDGRVLVFASKGYMDVKDFGQLNIKGKMISVGTGNGELNQTIEFWQKEHPINILWIETEADSGKYLPWFGIDPDGSDKLSFDDFANTEMLGRVFKWNEGDILFSDTDGSAYVPPDGCNIQASNIILSTEDPFSSTTAGKLNSNGGGTVTLKNVSFSDFNNSFAGMGTFRADTVSFFGSTYLTYCDDINCTSVISGIKDLYSSGLTVSYCTKPVLNEIHGMTVKSKGVSITYCKEVEATNLYGYVGLRDSSSDTAISLNTISESAITGLQGVGASITLDNVSDSEIKKLVLVDRMSLAEDTSQATSNLIVDSSSSNQITDILILENGGAALSAIRLKNSASIDIFKVQALSSHYNYIVSGEASFDTRVSELYYTDYRGSTPFSFDRKNNGLLLQNITSSVTPEISIKASNTILKGVQASSIDTDIEGARNFNLAQLYSDDSNGEILALMSKSSDFFTSFEGGVRWTAGARIYFSNLGDSVEFELPYNIKGVTLLDEDPEIVGQNTGALAVNYAISTETGWGSFLGLTKSNLSAEEIDVEKGFRLKIKITAGDIDATTFVSGIKLKTADSRASYPLDTVTGKIVFEGSALLDDHAMYFLYYADGYGTENAMMVKDADGSPVMGHVNFRDSVEFEYDYIGDTSLGRESRSPVEMVAVLAGLRMSKNKVIGQVFKDNQTNVFTLRTDREYMFKGE